jgi:hypothetical protein
MAAPVMGSFDDIEEVEFVKFDDGVVRMRFASSEFLAGENIYHNQCWTFSVVEGTSDKLLSITSKRLMLKLKQEHHIKATDA